jgi:FkbM family methyltransferase
MYGKILGRPWLSGLHRVFLVLSLHGLGYDNCYGGFSSTGEDWFIRHVLKKNNIKFCVDIGANVGNYSKALIQNLDCEVYAIEPFSASFSRLEELSRSFGGRIHPIKRAISNFDGEAVIYSRGGHLETTTLSKDLLSRYDIEEKVKVSRLDTLVEEGIIQGADFIKIDTEGFELEVFKGMGKTIEKCKPKFIQFEFNILQLKPGYTVFDIAKLLPYYEFYRLLPNGWLKIKQDSFLDNIFIFSNIVAKRKDF